MPAATTYEGTHGVVSDVELNGGTWEEGEVDLEEEDDADLEVLVATYNFISGYDAMPYLKRIRTPMLGLFPTDGPIAGDEQIDLLKATVPHVKIVRLATRYHAINISHPATCAQQLLHFAAEHDGIACHEV